MKNQPFFREHNTVTDWALDVRNGVDPDVGCVIHSIIL